MTKASKALYSSLASLITGGGAYGAYCASSDSNNDVIEITHTPITHQDQQLNNNINSLQTNPTPNNIPPASTQSAPTQITDEIRKLYEGQFHRDSLIQEAEQVRATQPWKWKFLYGQNNPKKSVGFQSAKETTKVIMDYTMRISVGGCESGNGTAWILDYVLPDEAKNEKYPTKFFIATAAHVANTLPWDKSNPYHQELSLGKAESAGYEWCPGGVTLIKEKVDHKDEDFDYRNWYQQRDKYKGREIWTQTHDVSRYSRLHNVHDLGDVLKYHFENPKLVYLPWNWLGNDSSKWGGRSFNKDYYLADFCILEVDFKDERTAQLFTRDFYNKYDPVKGSQADKALNFFAEPLAKKYTHEQLLNEDIRIWGAGYPAKGLSHKVSTNYLRDREKVASLMYYESGSIKDENGHEYLGHVDFSEYYSRCNPSANPSNPSFDCPGWSWNGKEVRLRGYGYAYKDSLFSEGASGSLTVAGIKTADGKEDARDVLGAFIQFLPGLRFGMSVALRNMEIKDKDGKVVNPAYDFIEGVDGQIGSYKEQIQKYVLTQGKKTNLSRLRNWTV